jgi:hypothetical protein
MLGYLQGLSELGVSSINSRQVKVGVPTTTPVDAMVTVTTTFRSVYSAGYEMGQLKCVSDPVKKSVLMVVFVFTP